MSTLFTRVGIAALGGFLGCVLLMPEARAQAPINDNCASATVVGTGTFTGSMAAATNDGSASCDPGGPLSRDVWFSFTSTSSGSISIDTCGTSCDTVLTIYSSCGGAELLCNDDCGGSPCGATASCVSGISVTAGTTVLIRISDKGLGCGNYTLHISAGNPGLVAAGSDCLYTPDGGCSYHDFASVPIPPNFFGPTAAPFNGQIAFKGAALTGSGIPPGTDTIIERLAAANLGVCPSSATIPIVIRALSLQSAVDMTVFFPPAGVNQPFATYRVEACLSTAVAQTNGFMTISRTHVNGGTFTSTLPVVGKFKFFRTGGGGSNPSLGAANATLDQGSFGQSITLSAPGVGTPPTTWVFAAPAASSPGGLVDHDCDSSSAQIGFAASTNFFVGFDAPGATCSSPGGPLVKQMCREDAAFARHCFLPVYIAPIDGPYCMCQGNNAPLPCLNAGGLGRGCENSGGTTGALLSVTGTAKVVGDDIQLTGSGILGSVGLFFQGTTTVQVPFGDGLLCAAGTITRLGVQGVLGGGAAYPTGTQPLVSVGGLIPAAGGMRTYQVWYRDASPTFCTTATNNLSNGYQLIWAP